MTKRVGDNSDALLACRLKSDLQKAESECSRLASRVEKLEKKVEHWKANHAECVHRKRIKEEMISKLRTENEWLLNLKPDEISFRNGHIEGWNLAHEPAACGHARGNRKDPQWGTGEYEGNEKCEVCALLMKCHEFHGSYPHTFEEAFGDGEEKGADKSTASASGEGSDAESERGAQPQASATKWAKDSREALVEILSLMERGGPWDGDVCSFCGTDEYHPHEEDCKWRLMEAIAQRVLAGAHAEEKE